MEITLEEIQKKFDSLPEDLKWAIMAANIDEKITAIGQAHGLNIEQLGQLSLETHMVTLGYTLPDNFEASIKASLGLPNDKTREIVEEINTKILKEIKEKLMSLSKNTEETQEAPVSTNSGEKTRPSDEPTSDILQKENERKEYELKKEEQNKKIMESIASKKLFGSFQTPTVKTEYTLNNLSKNQGNVGTSANQNVKIPLEATIQPVSSVTKDTSPSYSIKEDPYRVKPE